LSLAIRKSYFLILLGQNGDDKHHKLPFKGSRIKLCVSALTSQYSSDPSEIQQLTEAMGSRGESKLISFIK
jgi:hypothetical protein